MERTHVEFTRNGERNIRRDGHLLFARLLESAAPSTLVKSIRENGLEGAARMIPLEWKISVEVIAQTVDDAEELWRITTINPQTGWALSPFNSTLDQHDRLLRFMRTQCDLFKGQSADVTMRNGKKFLTRDEYYALKPEGREPYWTYTIDQIVTMLGAAARKQIESQLTVLTP